MGVAEGLPEELPLEGLGEPGGVVLDRLYKPGALRVGEKRRMLRILVWRKWGVSVRSLEQRRI